MLVNGNKHDIGVDPEARNAEFSEASQAALGRALVAEFLSSGEVGTRAVAVSFSQQEFSAILRARSKIENIEDVLRGDAEISSGRVLDDYLEIQRKLIREPLFQALLEVEREKNPDIDWFDVLSSLQGSIENTFAPAQNSAEPKRIEPEKVTFSVKE